LQTLAAEHKDERCHGKASSRNRRSGDGRASARVKIWHLPSRSLENVIHRQPATTSIGLTRSITNWDRTRFAPRSPSPTKLVVWEYGKKVPESQTLPGKMICILSQLLIGI
jgi:hypothetical protein